MLYAFKNEMKYIQRNYKGIADALTKKNLCTYPMVFMTQLLGARFIILEHVALFLKAFNVSPVFLLLLSFFFLVFFGYLDECLMKKLIKCNVMCCSFFEKLKGMFVLVELFFFLFWFLLICITRFCVLCVLKLFLFLFYHGVENIVFM